MITKICDIKNSTKKSAKLHLQVGS